MQTMIVTDSTDRLQQVINDKKAKNTQLNFAINDYVSLKLSYMEKSNEALLTTDFKKVLDESRPTVAMKEAYIENLLFDEKMQLELAKENVKTLQRDIDIINDEIKLFELKCQMELKE